MKLEIISASRDSSILVCDEHHNDIAEFYHSDHATVSQSYETALALAKQLVEGSRTVAQCSPDHIEKTNVGTIDWKMEVERLNREIVASEKRWIERCAGIAENCFGGKAHTYASENADLYRGQDAACTLIAAKIRALAIPSTEKTGAA